MRLRGRGQNMQNLFFRLGRAFVFGLGLTAAVALANVRVLPMSYDLATSGQGARQDLRVENTGSTPLPVELRVERREIQPDGTDRRTPADNDFLVFPPQGIVPANGFQTFRVQYVGDPAIGQTRLYLVTVAQVPVSGTGAQQPSGIQLVFNIGTLAAVSPASSTPEIVVDEVVPAAEANRLRITVRNNGTRYARLLNGTWTFTAANGTVETLEGEPLRAALQNSLIEAGGTRIISLPVSAAFVREGARASFQLARAR